MLVAYDLPNLYLRQLKKEGHKLRLENSFLFKEIDIARRREMRRAKADALANRGTNITL
jgi:hypothetical protein